MGRSRRRSPAHGEMDNQISAALGWLPTTWHCPEAYLLPRRGAPLAAGTEEPEGGE